MYQISTMYLKPIQCYISNIFQLNKMHEMLTPATTWMKPKTI